MLSCDLSCKSLTYYCYDVIYGQKWSGALLCGCLERVVYIERSVLMWLASQHSSSSCAVSRCSAVPSQTLHTSSSSLSSRCSSFAMTLLNSLRAFLLTTSLSQFWSIRWVVPVSMCIIMIILIVNLISFTNYHPLYPLYPVYIVMWMARLVANRFPSGRLWATLTRWGEPG